MRQIIAQILTVVLLIAPGKTMSADLATLDGYLWTARPLIIFAPAQGDPRLVQQLAWLDMRMDEMDARDVVVIVDIEDEELSELRKKFRPRDFQIVLIGKDGEVKLRKPFPWDVRELSRTIDKMPMRMQEMRSDRAE